MILFALLFSSLFPPPDLLSDLPADGLPPGPAPFLDFDEGVGHQRHGRAAAAASPVEPPAA